MSVDRGLERDAVHAVVRGEVQGVGFRYFVLDRANALGLDGWVRNRPEGAVECRAEGPRDRLERLLEDIRRGPPAAEVGDVDVSWEAASGEDSGFRIAH
jgi:acylphosphatase